MTTSCSTEDALDALVDRINRRPHRATWRVIKARRQRRALTVTLEHPDGTRQAFTFCQTSRETLDD